MNRPCPCSGYAQFDGCTGCEGVDLLGYDGEHILCEFDALSWPLSTDASCTDTWSTPFNPDRSDEWHSKSRNISTLNSVYLRRFTPQPTGYTTLRAANIAVFYAYDGCQWLFEDVIGINFQTRRVLTPPHILVGEYAEYNTYTPVNPVDATSPWWTSHQMHHIGGPGANPDCFIGSEWRCGHSFIGNGIGLEFKVGSTTDPFAAGTTLWWLLNVWAVARVRVIQNTADIHGHMSCNYIHGFNGTEGEHGTRFPQNPAGVCHELWTGTANMTFGLVLVYAKPVNCSEDFLGYPITLDLQSYRQDRADAIGITYPSTCQLTI